MKKISQDLVKKKTFKSLNLKIFHSDVNGFLMNSYAKRENTARKLFTTEPAKSRRMVEKARGYERIYNAAICWYKP